MYRETELYISGFLSVKRLREKTRSRQNALVIPCMSGMFPVFFTMGEKELCIYGFLSSKNLVANQNASVILYMSGMFSVVLFTITEIELYISGFLSLKKLREKTRSRRNALVILRMAGMFPVFLLLEKWNCAYMVFYPQRILWETRNRLNTPVIPSISRMFPVFLTIRETKLCISGFLLSKRLRGKTRTKQNASVILYMSGMFSVVLFTIREIKLYISGFLSLKKLREKTRSRRNAPVILHISGMFPVFFTIGEMELCIYGFLSSKNLVGNQYMFPYLDFYPQRLWEKTELGRMLCQSPVYPECFQLFFYNYRNRIVHIWFLSSKRLREKPELGGMPQSSPVYQEYFWLFFLKLEKQNCAYLDFYPLRGSGKKPELGGMPRISPVCLEYFLYFFLFWETELYISGFLSSKASRKKLN